MKRTVSVSSLVHPPEASHTQTKESHNPHFSHELVGLGIAAALEKSHITPKPVICVTRASIGVAEQKRESNATLVPSFLRKCCLCKKDIASSGRDIYMYRGIQAFCSAECRHQQIFEDEKMERKGKCLAVTRAKARSSNRQRTTKVTAAAA